MKPLTPVADLHPFHFNYTKITILAPSFEGKRKTKGIFSQGTAITKIPN